MSQTGQRRQPDLFIHCFTLQAAAWQSWDHSSVLPRTGSSSLPWRLCGHLTSSSFCVLGGGLDDYTGWSLLENKNSWEHNVFMLVEDHGAGLVALIGWLLSPYERQGYLEFPFVTQPHLWWPALLQPCTKGANTWQVPWFLCCVYTLNTCTQHQMKLMRNQLTL